MSKPFKIAILFFLVSIVIGGALYVSIRPYVVKSNTAPVAVENIQRRVQQQSVTTISPQPSVAGEKKVSIPPVTDADHIRGNKDAMVTFVEYSDLECPNCKRLHPIMKRLTQDYGNDFRWVYRHFPLTYHANAIKEAEASECAAEIGGNEKFWEYIDKIFERTTSNGTGFALEKLTPLAQEVGLDTTAFERCLNSQKYQTSIQQQYPLGLSYGIRGTPTTFVMNTKGQSFMIPGVQSYETLRAVILTLSK